MLQSEEVQHVIGLDERLQLIEDIIATTPFQKSARLPDLLRYMAEQTISGNLRELTEQRIGRAVFGKPAEYSPLEDSSVRVHVRQLRLKLHEFFDGEGRHSPLIVEIPKGGYSLVFRHSESAEAPIVSAPLREAPSPPSPLLMPAPKKLWSSVALPWLLAGIMTVAAVYFGFQSRGGRNRYKDPPWPLASVLIKDQESRVIVADINYGMLRIMGQRSGSLEEYLSANYQQEFLPAQMSPSEERTVRYLSGSLLTSYADVVVVNALANLAATSNGAHITVRSARDLRLRDMQEGNYILIGSPGSNPWVTLFSDRLNFIEREGVVGQSLKFFENKHPRLGEPATYQGLEFTGATGVDYATISLLPLPSGHGNVLIVQGLQQEGTEAAGMLLADLEGRKRLERALGLSGDPTAPVYFEVLLRTTAVGGASNAAEIVATRIIKP